MLLQEKLEEDVVPEMIIGYQYSIGYSIDNGNGKENKYYEIEEKYSDDGVASFFPSLPFNKDAFIKKDRGYFIQCFKNNFRQNTENYPSLYWARIFVVYITAGGHWRRKEVDEKDVWNVCAAGNNSLARLRIWLSMLIESRKPSRSITPPSSKPYVRLLANYVLRLGDVREAWDWDEVELIQLLSEQDYESLKVRFLGHSSLPYGAFEDEAGEALDSVFGPHELGIEPEVRMAPGERERLTADIRYLDEEDVRRMQAIIKEIGDSVSREELLSGLENCYIRKEVWTRETGHLWEVYSLLDRKHSKEEYDFADTWDVRPVRLTLFSTEKIIKMLKEVELDR